MHVERAEMNRNAALISRASLDVPSLIRVTRLGGYPKYGPLFGHIKQRRLLNRKHMEHELGFLGISLGYFRAFGVYLY